MDIFPKNKHFQHFEGGEIDDDIDMSDDEGGHKSANGEDDEGDDVVNSCDNQSQAVLHGITLYRVNA